MTATCRVAEPWTTKGSSPSGRLEEGVVAGFGALGEEAEAIEVGQEVFVEDDLVEVLHQGVCGDGVGQLVV